MKSKVERVKDSIENIEAAVDYYLRDAKQQYQLGKMSKSDYLKLDKNLNIINRIIVALWFKNPMSNDTLDEIRKINLSISSLYEENDYNMVFTSIINTNERLYGGNKNRDRELLNSFKKVFNNLTNFYKYRLSKAIKSDNSIVFMDKKFDNVKCIIENYLNDKYNFKKIPFERLSISDADKHIIDVCNMVTESDHFEEEIKNIYSSIKTLVSKMANAEIIVRELKKIIAHCNRQEFINILIIAKKMINKYTSIYNKSKEKYDVLIDYLMVNGINVLGFNDINSVIISNAKPDALEEQPQSTNQI